MTVPLKTGLVGAAAALGVVGLGSSFPAGEDVYERANSAQPVSSASADRARHAALERFPGGRVSEVEAETEATAAFEVEVTRRDGTAVEVQLDRDYRFLGIDDEDGGSKEPEDTERDAEGTPGGR